jgi:hypothetical protein
MGTDTEMSQEDQARLLVEPSFTSRLRNEDALLEAEFGLPDEAGYYGRQPNAAPDLEALEPTPDPVALEPTADPEPVDPNPDCAS